MPRRFRSATESSTRYREELPLSKPVGLYYRQSKEPTAKTGNVSTTIQTVDMYHNLQRMGWKEDQIILIDVDSGVSGRLPIDERDGMRELFGLILDRRVGAVAAVDEDRFFRDETMIQVDTFVFACEQADVRVITPNFIYDFNHPQQGSFHKKLFRWQCERGAEFITNQIIKRLGGARDYLMSTGRWAGSHMAVGYMVDTRAEIGGIRNPNHRMFVPFEPFAEVVREYFRLLVHYGGDLSRTHHHIVEQRAFFPDPDSCLPPQGFKTRYILKLRRGGYYPSRSGLRFMLTNPVYIGHWVHEDVVVRRNNHEPIVPEELFWKAFNYLSPYNLDGSPNPHYRSVKHNSRPTLEANRPVKRPLCAGLFYALVDGDKYIRANTVWKEKRGLYTYEFGRTEDEMGMRKTFWNRDSRLIDDAISYHVIERLKKTFSDERWQQSIEQLKAEQQRENESIKVKQRQVQIAEQKMQNLLMSLENLTKPDEVRYAEERYEYWKAERERLIASIESEQPQQFQESEFLYMREHFEEILSNWKDMDRDVKHLFLQRMIDRIVLLGAPPRGPSRLKIIWRGGEEEEITVGVTANHGTTWTYEEQIKLQQLVERGLSNREIRKHFSHRTRGSVFNRIQLVKAQQEHLSEVVFKPFDPYALMSIIA